MVCSFGPIEVIVVGKDTAERHNIHLSTFHVHWALEATWSYRNYGVFGLCVCLYLTDFPCSDERILVVTDVH